MKSSIFGKTRQEIQEIATQFKLPPYGATQISEWLYKKHVRDFSGMTNLSKQVRQDMEQAYQIGVTPPEKVFESQDGTKKYIFRAEKGYVETAFIPEGERSTLCISSQVGCKMRCTFCMTGKQGFHGNLSCAEILNQYESLPERDNVSNIVYMGMGEPLDNIQNVLQSLEIFTSAYGYAKSPGRLTVSTIGIVSEMKTFLEKTECDLAVSLHSPFEEERQRWIPVSRENSLNEILKLLKRFPFRHQRRVTFEYTVFEGLNHSQSHAKQICRILNGLRCRVNLLYFNPLPECNFRRASSESMEKFQSLLKDKGILVTIRKSRGQDIGAACGLLGSCLNRSSNGESNSSDKSSSNGESNSSDKSSSNGESSSNPA